MRSWAIVELQRSGLKPWAWPPSEPRLDRGHLRCSQGEVQPGVGRVDSRSVDAKAEAERQQEIQVGRGWLAGGPSVSLPLCESYLRLARLPDAERIAERVSKIVPSTAALEAQALYLLAEITAHLERKQSDEAESC